MVFLDIVDDIYFADVDGVLLHDWPVLRIYTSASSIDNVIAATFRLNLSH